VNAEQRRHHLEIVFDPVMHFADQSLLTLERGARFMLGLRDPFDRPPEGLAKLADFVGGSKAIGDRQRAVVLGAISDDHALQPAQRADQQAVDHPPADQRGRDPHQERQEQEQLLACRDPRRRDRQPRLNADYRHREGEVEHFRTVAAARQHDQLIAVVNERGGGDRDARFGKLGAQRRDRNPTGRRAADDTRAQEQRVIVRRNPGLEIAGREPLCRWWIAHLSDHAELPTRIVEQRKLARNLRGDGQNALGPGARVSGAAGKRCIGRNP